MNFAVQGYARQTGAEPGSPCHGRARQAVARTLQSVGGRFRLALPGMARLAPAERSGAPPRNATLGGSLPSGEELGWACLSSPWRGLAEPASAWRASAGRRKARTLKRDRWQKLCAACSRPGEAIRAPAGLRKARQGR